MYRILSVGGSIIIPKTGFDIEFLKKFRNLILGRVKRGEKFILIIGGGDTCRQYQNAAKAIVSISEFDLDVLGTSATVFNANFVRLLFKEQSYPEVIQDPTQKVKTNKPIIVAAGWRPGCSTDKRAIMHANNYGAKEVFNLSNIEYVYDKDPNKYPDAQKIEKISWTDFRRDIVGYKWEAGANKPFDPIASQLAQKLGMKVVIVNGTDLKEVTKALNGQKFKGTIIE